MSFFAFSTFSEQTYPVSCDLDYILRTKFGYKVKYDRKGLNHERKFGVGGFMNVHVDIGRWSMQSRYILLLLGGVVIFKVSTWTKGWW